MVHHNRNGACMVRLSKERKALYEVCFKIDSSSAAGRYGMPPMKIEIWDYILRKQHEFMKKAICPPDDGYIEFVRKKLGVENV